MDDLSRKTIEEASLTIASAGEKDSGRLDG
jgi:hypothetical protein